MDVRSRPSLTDLNSVASVFHTQVREYVTSLPFYDPRTVTLAGMETQPTAAVTGDCYALGPLEGRAKPKEFDPTALRWQYVSADGGFCSVVWQPEHDWYFVDLSIGRDYGPGSPVDEDNIYEYQLSFTLYWTPLPVRRPAMDDPYIGRYVSRRVQGGRPLRSADPLVPYPCDKATILDLVLRRLRPHSDPRVFLEDLPRPVLLHPHRFDPDLARTSGYLDALASWEADEAARQEPVAVANRDAGNDAQTWATEIAPELEPWWGAVPEADLLAEVDMWLDFLPPADPATLATETPPPGNL